jgi:hypothetical protein
MGSPWPLHPWKTHSAVIIADDLAKYSAGLLGHFSGADVRKCPWCFCPRWGVRVARFWLGWTSGKTKGSDRFRVDPPVVSLSGTTAHLPAVRLGVHKFTSSEPPLFISLQVFTRSAACGERGRSSPGCGEDSHATVASSPNGQLLDGLRGHWRDERWIRFWGSGHASILKRC